MYSELQNFRKKSHPVSVLFTSTSSVSPTRRLHKGPKVPLTERTRANKRFLRASRPKARMRGVCALHLSRTVSSLLYPETEAGEHFQTPRPVPVEAARLLSAARGGAPEGHISVWDRVADASPCCAGAGPAGGGT